ncbi:MAG: DUF2238 domain-containing protein, partial [Woeseia sp.]|nr:DUF2238 domain-containing protein [Woeseia sp.]
YDRWMTSLFGTGLNDMLGWDRNHYDRIVHFLWGLFLTYPIREIVLRVSRARGFWAYLLPFLIVISTSTIYELIEWLAALVFGEGLGIAFLGTQGDIWDAQKDMALALFGSFVATLLIVALNASLDRDFAHEWNESLRVKQHQPLGEYEIVRLMSERDKDKNKN